MKDPRMLISAIVAAALGACAIILVWKGDVAHAMVFGALLTNGPIGFPTSSLTSANVSGGGVLSTTTKEEVK